MKENTRGLILAREQSQPRGLVLGERTHSLPICTQCTYLWCGLSNSHVAPGIPFAQFQSGNEQQILWALHWENTFPHWTWTEIRKTSLPLHMWQYLFHNEVEYSNPCKTMKFSNTSKRSIEYCGWDFGTHLRGFGFANHEVVSAVRAGQG